MPWASEHSRLISPISQQLIHVKNQNLVESMLKETECAKEHLNSFNMIVQGASQEEQGLYCGSLVRPSGLTKETLPCPGLLLLIHVYILLVKKRKKNN